MQKLTLLCLLSSIIGLLLIYYAALMLKPMRLRLDEIDLELVGRKVATTGYIIYRRNHVAGHVFLIISNRRAKIEVPIFSDLASKLKNVRELKVGRKVFVSGVVDYYKGRLQIIPRKPEDVRLIR